MATEVAIDADDLSLLRRLGRRPEADHVVLFLNLASACNDATVAAVEALGLTDQDEVVVCDEWPEAADLAILSWRAANTSVFTILPPITDDRGLQDAFSEGFTPANPGWRQTMTGLAMVSPSVGAAASLAELLQLLAVPTWAQRKAEGRGWRRCCASLPWRRSAPHSPWDSIRITRRRFCGMPSAPLACGPHEIEGALAAQAASGSVAPAPLPAVHVKIVSPEPDSVRIAAKGLDLHAYPSRGCRDTSLYWPIDGFLRRERIRLSDGDVSMLTIALHDFVRDKVRWLADWTIVRDGWLLWNRRGASAFVLKPGDAVQVQGTPELFQRTPAGMIALTLARSAARPGEHIIGLVTDQPSVVALSTRPTPTFHVAKCISPLTYRLSLPPAGTPPRPTPPRGGRGRRRGGVRRSTPRWQGVPDA